MGTAVLGVVADVQYDLRRLHGLWMAVAFPQLRESHPVLNRWTPETPRERFVYRVWSLLGVAGLLVVYPLTVAGLLVRFHARRFDRTTTRLGAIGSLLLLLVAWGALTALARARFSTEGFLAVAAAGSVAVVAAVLAFAFAAVDGRTTTVLFAYPLAMVAVFLPPVVAAFYSPTLAAVVFPRSETLAEWFLDTVLDYRNLNDRIRDRFELEGFAYVAMWTGVAVPVGWLLGLLVTLANLVRPTPADEDE